MGSQLCRRACVSAIRPRQLWRPGAPSPSRSRSRSSPLRSFVKVSFLPSRSPLSPRTSCSHVPYSSGFVGIHDAVSLSLRQASQGKLWEEAFNNAQRLTSGRNHLHVFPFDGKTVEKTVWCISKLLTESDPVSLVPHRDEWNSIIANRVESFQYT